MEIKQMGILSKDFWPLTKTPDYHKAFMAYLNTLMSRYENGSHIIWKEIILCTNTENSIGC